MILKEKTKRKIRTVLASTLIICLAPVFQRVRTVSGASSMAAFAGKEIVCAIDLNDQNYGAKGLETGLNYELLEKFASDNRCSVKIVAANKGTDYLDSLKNGKIDILVSREEKEMDNLLVSKELHNGIVWTVKDGSNGQMRQINNWIGHFTSSADFQSTVGRYYGSYNPLKKAEKGIRCKEVSPYDAIIKQNAKSLGWDWRMLAAVVYQESKFSIASRSPRGAVGLMQVMPHTGKHYGNEDLLNPRENIKTGTEHLKRLQNMFSKYNLSDEELIKFTLAAYNAGEGRIIDCRNFAASKNVNPDNWDEIVKLIPLMREDSILQEESVKLGKFQGYETIAYVDSVLCLYDAICEICPR